MGVNDSSGRCGMTLIEVMLASTILAISLTALLTASSRCIAVMRAARYYQEAQWTLSLAELEHPITVVEDVEDLEVRGERYGDLVYSRTVELRDEAQEDGLFLIRSRVSWTDKERTLNEEVVRFLYVPEDAGD